jgi:hypothetical protein
MGTFFSLSKSATSIALDSSEIALLLFGILLTLGLIGEYAKSERWKRHVRTFEMFVIIGVAGELFADGGIFLFSSHLQTIADLEIAEVTKQAGVAKNSANEAAGAAQRAKEQSDQAVASASNALTIASGARKEADSFEKDIVSAKTLAAGAESHLADALQRAAKAEEELYRLRTPRSLVNTAKLIAALQQFRGTEYTLNVFMDTESSEFTKAVAKVLDDGGWTRKQPTVIRLGIPDILLTFDKGEEHVPACLDTGIALRVPIKGVTSKESLAVLQSLPPQSLPKPLQAAIALQSAMETSISPPNERNVVKEVIDPRPSLDGRLTICVGKKP